jgi:hypothetical protein
MLWEKENTKLQRHFSTKRDILHLHYIHIPGENVPYIITYWSFSQEKINIDPTNLSICTPHCIMFSLFTSPRASGTYHPLALPVSSPFLMLDTTHIYTQVVIIHRIVLTAVTACRERRRRVWLARACVTSFSFVFNLFTKERDLYFLSSVGFHCHENCNETSIKLYTVL